MEELVQKVLGEAVEHDVAKAVNKLANEVALEVAAAVIEDVINELVLKSVGAEHTFGIVLQIVVFGMHGI